MLYQHYLCNKAIENYEKIMEIDEDLLVVYDKEMKNGLWIDLNEEYCTKGGKTNYEFVYENRICGSLWTNKFLK